MAGTYARPILAGLGTLDKKYLIPLKSPLTLYPFPLRGEDKGEGVIFLSILLRLTARNRTTLEEIIDQENHIPHIYHPITGDVSYL